MGSSADVNVISSDESGLTIELQTPPLVLNNVRAPDGENYQRLQVKGWTSISEAGLPLLPVRGVLIQVPDSGESSIEILEVEQESIPNINPYPVPRLHMSGSGKITEIFVKDQAAYESAAFFPEDLVTVMEVGILRGVSVARVMMHPFQWNPATGELLYTKKLRFRVHYGKPLAKGSPAKTQGSMASSDPFDYLLRKTLLNYAGLRVVDASPSGTEEPEAVDELSSNRIQSIKIETKGGGITRLSFDELVGIGLDAKTIKPKTFRLLNRGKEVAIRVVSKTKNRFQTGDYLEFYAEPLDNTYTDTNVYWLQWGGLAGKRMKTISGLVQGQREPIKFFKSHLHIEENHRIWEGTPGAPDKDYWFWERLAAPIQKSYSLSIPSPAGGTQNATIRVNFHGYTTAPSNPNHHTRLILNGTQIGDALWDGKIPYVQEATVPANLLYPGDNFLVIELPGDTGAPADLVYLNWIELDYRRKLEAVGDELLFSVEANGRSRVQVSQISQSGVALYDISNPMDPKIVKDFTLTPEGLSYTLTFEDRIVGQKTYYLVGDSAVPTPYRLEPVGPVTLRKTANGADYLIITPRSFLPAVKPLCNHRRNQGFRVKAVSVEDIYNEFSFGVFDPKAIKDFLSYAYTKWRRPAPGYVLLLGDANTDYRDYFGTGKINQVPTHLSITHVLGLTPDDNWFAAVEGNDPLPEMFIGRISAKDSNSAAQVVEKVIDYETGEASKPSKALFVADNDDPSFEDLDEELIGYLPKSVQAQRVYLADYAQATEATQDILSKLNEGMALTTYVGHGHVTIWAAEKIFQSSDIALLNNDGKLTFAITLDCLNGYFAHPYYYSIGEELTIAPNKGAIASFSPSGSGYFFEHAMLGREIFASIFEGGDRRLGKIATQSKVRAYAKGMPEEGLVMFTLLGDPGTVLKIAK